MKHFALVALLGSVNSYSKMIGDFEHGKVCQQHYQWIKENKFNTYNT